MNEDTHSCSICLVWDQPIEAYSGELHACFDLCGECGCYFPRCGPLSGDYTAANVLQVHLVQF